LGVMRRQESSDCEGAEYGGGKRSRFPPASRRLFGNLQLCLLIRRAGKQIEIEGEVLSRLDSRGRILFETMLQDPLKRQRYFVVGVERWRVIFEDGGHGLSTGLAEKSALAGQHLVQDDTEGKDVGARIDGFAANLFR
jgi:hypothetical protein